MKNAKKYFTLALSVTLLNSPAAFADKEDVGTIVGGILGGLIGDGVGKKGSKTETTIIGVLIGGLVGNRIGNEMDKTDRQNLDRASRACFEGEMNRDVDWQGRNFRGRVRSTRQGYYNSNSGRLVCRDFRSEVYRRDGSVEVSEGTVCKSRNGWKNVDRRHVDYSSDYDSGYDQDYGQDSGYDSGYDNGQNQGGQINLGNVGPVSRRTGGEYLGMNVSPSSLRSIKLQSTGDRIKIYRVLVTTLDGNQQNIAGDRMNQFLTVGNTLTVDVSSLMSQVVRVDILAEAWGPNLGINIIGETKGSQSHGGIGGGIGNGQGGYEQIMDPRDFQAMISEIRRASFDRDKLQVVKSWVSEIRRMRDLLSARQLADVASLFSFDDDRVAAIESLAQVSSVRRSELQIVDSACTFSSCRESVRRILFRN